MRFSLVISASLIVFSLSGQEAPDLREDFSSYFVPENIDIRSGLVRNLYYVRYRSRGYDNRFVENFYIDRSDGENYWEVLSTKRKSDRVENSSVGYAITNRDYIHRLSASLNLPIGNVYAERRFGRSGYTDGVWSDITTVGAGFKIKGLSLFAVFNTTERGVRSAATQEVYSLSADNYYNPNWGINNGKERSSRVRGALQSYIQGSYTHSVGDDLILNASLSGFATRNKYSSLIWYDAPTPLPDYYRYLPEFTSDAVSQRGWESGDRDVTQVNWRRMYEANLFSQNDRRSHYVVGDRVSDKINITLALDADYKTGEHSSMNFNAGFGFYNSENYMQMNDLMGGDYWLDVDQYLLDDEYYGDKIENDVRNPGRKISASEKFGYNYSMQSKTYDVGVKFIHDIGITATLSVGGTTHRRSGNYEKALFPGDQSYGLSKPLNFYIYDAMLNWAIRTTGRSMLTLSAQSSTYAPFVRDIFISPNYRNQVVPNTKTPSRVSIEAKYGYSHPLFSYDARLFYTTFSGGSDVRSYYDDIEREYCNIALSGISTRHTGAEFDLEYNPIARIRLRGVFSYGLFEYSSNPRVDIFRDKDASVVVSDSDTKYKGHKLPGVPSFVAVAEVRYRSRTKYSMGLSLCYTNENYVSMNPVRRMTRTAELATSPEMRTQTISQENLGDAFTLNFSLSKDFRLGSDAISVWINFENVLNNRNIRYGGYEQMRFRALSDSAGGGMAPFASKFHYAYGTMVYASVSYKF